MCVPPESDLAGLSTVALLDKAGRGDVDARNVLYQRYLVRLQRWARGRLPRHARGTMETDDLVQETLLKTLMRVEHFNPEHSGAFLGYVRRAIENRIVDEVRRAKRRPPSEETPGGVMDPRPSPLDEVLAVEKWNLYERAFERLTLSEQAAITARLEDGLPYQEIARELGKPSADAARVAVSRALVRLAQEMKAIQVRSNGGRS
jgi:RNA polymerase sigma-70 factor (ECF subfamily)